MKLIYIGGPFSALTREGVEDNIRTAERLALEVARIGGFPVCPHTNTGHPEFESLQPYQFWIEGTMELLRKCDAVILTADWVRSAGARGEMKEADRLGIPCFFSVEGLGEWLNGGQS